MASERIRQIESDAKDRIDAAEITVQEYAKEITRLESGIKQAQNAAQEAIHRERGLSGRMTTLEVEKASCEAALKVKDTEAAKSDERLDTLQQRFDTLQQELLTLAKENVKSSPSSNK